MGRITVNLNVTLDGVMQAPGRADEDARDGFALGGSATRYFDPSMGGRAAQGEVTAALLFGRRTYEDFYSVWPHRTGNPFSTVLDNSTKYVASRTLREPLPWQNSVLLAGDAIESVAALKVREPHDLVILGSGELVRALLRANLVDEYVLSIHPLVLGSGRRLFDPAPPTAFDLVDTKTTPTGVVIATYRPSQRPRTGAA